MLNKLTSVLGRLLDPNGNLSFGRFATALLVIAVISWDSCYVWMSWKFNLAHSEFHIPLTEMLPNVAVMIGQVAFMTAFYVTTKVQESVDKSNDKDKANGMAAGS
jgi:hypothetical protein